MLKSYSVRRSPPVGITSHSESVTWNSDPHLVSWRGYWVLDCSAKAVLLIWHKGGWQATHSAAYKCARRRYVGNLFPDAWQTIEAWWYIRTVLIDSDAPVHSLKDLEQNTRPAELKSFTHYLLRVIGRIRLRMFVSGVRIHVRTHEECDGEWVWLFTGKMQGGIKSAVGISTL